MATHVFLPRANLERWARGLPALLVFPLLAAGAGCLSYPDSDERVDDSVVYTHFDEKANFGKFKTFSISDEVLVFSEDDGEIEGDPLTGSSAKALVSKMTEEMEDRGYTKVESTDSPDLGVTLSVLNGEVVGYYSYWASYWGYGGWYYNYPYAVSYSYETGTLVMEIADLNKAAADRPDPDGDGGLDGTLSISWLGAVYGVLLDTKSENLDRGLDGIEQAFKQSPYLKSK